MRTSHGFLVALAITASLSAGAQEQTFQIGGPRGIVPPDAAALITPNASITLNDAPTIIAATLGSAVLNTPDFYCMIHVLHWTDAGKVDAQNWYLYSTASGWSDAQFNGLRIFGSHNVALLYLHTNVPTASVEDMAKYLAGSKVTSDLYTTFNARPDAQKKNVLEYEIARNQVGVVRGASTAFPDILAGKFPPAVQSEVTRSGLDALSVDDLEKRYLAVLGAGQLSIETGNQAGMLTALPAGTHSTLQSGGQDLVKVDQLPYFAPQSYNETNYKVDVTKKLPSSIQDLLALASLHGASRGNDKVATTPRTIWGGMVMRIGPVPSDVKVTPTVSQDSKSAPLDARTFDNEGRYFWDISAGIPVKSISDTTYDSSAGTLSPKNVSRQSLFAMLNIFPMKVDTKGTDYRWLTPVALVGLGVTGKPLDRVMFGGGIGLNKIQVFVGTALTVKQFPGPPTNPAAIRTARRTNLIYGLNVPIRQILQTLKAAK